MDIETVDDVFDTAQLLLDTLNAVYQEHGDAVSPLPVRQIIAAGGPGSQPHDCEQVSISFGQIYTGMPGSPSEGPVTCFNAPLTAVFYVEVVRKTIPPSPTARRGSQGTSALAPEQEAAISKVQMQDARLLLHAGMTVGDAGVGSVADVGIGAESGGYQAVTMTVMTQVI